MSDRTSNLVTNRDKALRGEVVVVSDGRLREMQEQAIRFEGIADGTYHWHWAAVMNELIARRAADTSTVRHWTPITTRPPSSIWLFVGGGDGQYWYVGGPWSFSEAGVDDWLAEQGRIGKYSHWARAPEWLNRAPDEPGESHGD